MTYVRVQDGIVREVFEAKPIFHPDLMASILDAPKTVKPGQIHKDGKFFDPPPPPPASAREQIAAIERQITPRRLREAVLGIDKAWLAQRDAEIAKLRAKL